MATIARTQSHLPFVGDDAITGQWTPLTNAGADVGDPVENGGWGDRSVQVQGTFGAGGTCVIEGSNDGVNYQTLHDPLGNSLSFTAAGLKAVMEISRYMRPRVSAGDGTTSLTVSFFLRKG